MTSTVPSDPPARRIATDALMRRIGRMLTERGHPDLRVQVYMVYLATIWPHAVSRAGDAHGSCRARRRLAVEPGSRHPLPRRPRSLGRGLLVLAFTHQAADGQSHGVRNHALSM